MYLFVQFFKLLKTIMCGVGVLLKLFFSSFKLLDFLIVQSHFIL